MRAWIMSLVVAVLAGGARGEVVINNLGSITSTYTADTGTGQFSFSGPIGWALQSVQVNVKNNSGSSLTAGTNFFFQVGFSGAGSHYLTPGANLASGASSVFTLDLSTFGYVTSGASQVLALSFWDGNSGTPNALTQMQFATSSSAPSVASGWSFNTTSPQGAGPQNISFALTAVPEPGTLILGGIAAACGGGGVWWRRKRKVAPVVEEEAATAV